MADQKEYLTKEKFAELEKELDFLRKTKRKEVAEDLEYSKSLGDLAENAEYHEARENQGEVEDRIMKIESILGNAEIVALHHTELVGIGSTVTIQREGANDTMKINIVGSEETDVKKGKISLHSPLGEAMIGKKKSDVFSFTSPGGKMTYKVIDIA